MTEDKPSFLKRNKYYIYSIAGPLISYLFYETRRQYESNKNFLHNTSPLKRSESILRSEIIKNIKYDLFLYLENPQIPTLKNYQGYKGHVMINFDLNTKRTIHLDYLGDIISFKLNNKQYFPKLRKNKLIISEDSLNYGENSIEVVFISKYSIYNDKVLGLSYTFDPNTVRYVNIESE
jgi:hypothetical protein